MLVWTRSSRRSSDPNGNRSRAQVALVELSNRETVPDHEVAERTSDPAVQATCKRLSSRERTLVRIQSQNGANNEANGNFADATKVSELVFATYPAASKEWRARFAPEP